MSLVGWASKGALGQLAKRPKLAIGIGGALAAYGSMAFNRDRASSSDYGMYGTESPLMRQTKDISSQIMDGSSLLGIGATIGLEVGSYGYRRSAFREAKNYYRNLNKGLRGAGTGMASISGRTTVKRGLFGGIKQKTNKDLLQRLSKIPHGNIASKASTALRLGKWAKFTGWGSLAMIGFQMVADNFQLPDPIRPYQPPRQASLGGTFNDSEEAYTQRQRAIQAIQSSQYSGRAGLGNESSFFHA